MKNITKKLVMKAFIYNMLIKHASKLQLFFVTNGLMSSRIMKKSIMSPIKYFFFKKFIYLIFSSIIAGQTLVIPSSFFNASTNFVSSFVSLNQHSIMNM